MHTAMVSMATYSICDIAVLSMGRELVHDCELRAMQYCLASFTGAKAENKANVQTIY